MSKKFVVFLAVLLLPVLVLSGCGLPALPMSAVASQSAAPQAKAPAAAAVQATAPAVAAVQATAPASAPASAAVSGDLLDALQEKLGQIYDQVNPSVVNIQVVLNAGSASSGFQGIPNLPGIPGFPNLPQGQAPSPGALASGFVWDKEGYIVTNNHVVADADKITVTFVDDTIVPAKVVGTDPDSDLAVIKVDLPAEQLQPVQLADSTAVKVGQIAVAIGNPFGLEGTMTVGFVSALGRSLPVDSANVAGPSFSIPDIIQTDAPINPGNSGGVLVNEMGQVIGVPMAIESQVGQSAGIGFAVPSAIVQRVVPALIKDGSVQHPWLGISGKTLTSELAQAMDLGADQRGVLVGEVTSGGPADKAGLHGSDKQADVNGQQVQVGGDVIVAINGQPVKEFDDLVIYLARSTSVGDKITLTILRGGQEKTVDVTLAARPQAQGQQAQSQSSPRSGTAGAAWLGIQGLDVTAEIAGAMDLAQDQQGVLVEQVVQGSPAEEAGLRGSFKSADISGQSLKVGGDVIVSADGQTITSMAELRSFLADAEAGQQVTLTILRDGRQMTVDVTLGERPASTP
jgi:serine protease Do